MDLNLMVICGRLVAPGELRQFESGARLLRLLVAVRTEKPRKRVDVIPITVWDPDENLVSSVSEPGVRVWVAGAVQRRFWDGSGARRSRLEVVANQVEIREPDSEEIGVGA